MTSGAKYSLSFIKLRFCFEDKATSPPLARIPYTAVTCTAPLNTEIAREHTGEELFNIIIITILVRWRRCATS